MTTECLNMHNFPINARMLVSLVTKPTEVCVLLLSITVDPVNVKRKRVKPDLPFSAR